MTRTGRSSNTPRRLASDLGYSRWRSRFDGTRQGTGGMVALGPARLTPPPVKRHIIRGYTQRHGVEILLEAGTYLGDTVTALRDAFREVHPVSLSPELSSRARERSRTIPMSTSRKGDGAARYSGPRRALQRRVCSGSAVTDPAQSPLAVIPTPPSARSS